MPAKTPQDKLPRRRYRAPRQPDTTFSGLLFSLYRLLTSPHFLYCCLLILIISSVPMASARSTRSEESAMDDLRSKGVYKPSTVQPESRLMLRASAPVPEFAFLVRPSGVSIGKALVNKTNKQQAKTASDSMAQEINLLFSRQEDLQKSSQLLHEILYAIQSPTATQKEKDRYLGLLNKFLQYYRNPHESNEKAITSESKRRLGIYLNEYVSRFPLLTADEYSILSHQLVFYFIGYEINEANLQADWFKRDVINFINAHYPELTLEEFLKRHPGMCLSRSIFSTPTEIYLNAALLAASRNHSLTFDKLIKQINIGPSLEPLIQARIEQDIEGNNIVLTTISLSANSEHAIEWRKQLSHFYERAKQGDYHSLVHIGHLYADVEDSEMAKRCYAQAAVAGEAKGLTWYLLWALQFSNNSHPETRLGIFRWPTLYNLLGHLSQSFDDPDVTYLYALLCMMNETTEKSSEILERLYSESNGLHQYHIAWVLGHIYADKRYEITHSRLDAERYFRAASPLYGFDYSMIERGNIDIELPRDYPAQLRQHASTLTYILYGSVAAVVGCIGYFALRKNPKHPRIPNQKNSWTQSQAKESIRLLNEKFHPIQFKFIQAKNGFAFEISTKSCALSYRDRAFRANKSELIEALINCYPTVFVKEHNRFKLTPDTYSNLQLLTYVNRHIEELYLQSSCYLEDRLAELNELCPNKILFILKDQQPSIMFIGEPPYHFTYAGNDFNLTETQVICALRKVLKSVVLQSGSFYRFTFDSSRSNYHLKQDVLLELYKQSDEYNAAQESESARLASVTPQYPTSSPPNRKVVRHPRRGRGGPHERRAKTPEPPRKPRPAPVLANRPIAKGTASQARAAISTSPEDARSIALTQLNQRAESLVSEIQKFETDTTLERQLALKALLARYFEFQAHHHKLAAVTAVRDQFIHGVNFLTMASLYSLRELLLAHENNKQIVDFGSIIQAMVFDEIGELPLEELLMQVSKAQNKYFIIGAIIALRETVFSQVDGKSFPKKLNYSKGFVAWFDKLTDIRNRWLHYDYGKPIQATELFAFAQTTRELSQLIQSELSRLLNGVRSNESLRRAVMR